MFYHKNRHCFAGLLRLGLAMTAILTITCLFFLYFSMGLSAAIPTTRYFYSGNGEIRLISAHNKNTFSGTYRSENGQYLDEAINKINSVFGAEPGKISIRLIEFLDYLQDNFKGSVVTIVSGYRDPEYNNNLRQKGALAGKASLHQYGMAADIMMTGVSSKMIWEYIRSMNFGAAGYYHGKNVHVDVGPHRWWDEKTSGVGTDLADENKLIMIVSDKDIYLRRETILLDFARMTAWPIGVNTEFLLEQMEDKKIVGRRSSVVGRNSVATDECYACNDISSMSNLPFEIPSNIKTGRYRIRARFCDKTWEAMPSEITTPEFEIREN